MSFNASTPKFMSHAETIALIGALVFGLLTANACGPNDDADSKNVPLSPSDKLTSFADQPELSARCRLVGKGGCGELLTNGNAMGGQFAFRELFADCNVDTQGWHLKLRNAVQEQDSTFNLSVLVYAKSMPAAQQICIGPEYIEDSVSNARILKKGYCEVNFANHSFFAGTTKRTPCLVTTTIGKNTITGSVQCPMLEQNKSFVIIEGGSRFDCPIPK